MRFSGELAAALLAVSALMQEMRRGPSACVDSSIRRRGRHAFHRKNLNLDRKADITA